MFDLQGRGHFRKPKVATWVGFYFFSFKPGRWSWRSSLVSCRVTNGGILSITVPFHMRVGHGGETAVRSAIMASCGACGSQIVCPFHACSREERANRSNVTEPFRPFLYTLTHPLWLARLCCWQNGTNIMLCLSLCTGFTLRTLAKACCSIWPRSSATRTAMSSTLCSQTGQVTHLPSTFYLIRSWSATWQALG